MSPLDFENLRKKMVREQLEARRITDPRVLSAMREIPRHRFVPDDFANLAYNDSPLPIGEEQTISQPFIVGYMSQCLSLKGNETVLEIGSGSGYQTAILCKLAEKVISLERHMPLAESAAQKLTEMGLTNYEIYCGDGSQGLSDMAPFDAILVTAAAPAIPQRLLMQLAEGGRLVLPVGDRQQQYIQRAVRTRNTWQIEQLIPVMFVPLLGRYGFSERASDSPQRTP